MIQATGGQTCLSCRDIPEPVECTYVTECGSHEQCFVQKYVTNAGHVRYHVGCADNLTCNTFPQSRNSLRILGADNSVVCEACCNDTKLCNNENLCGSLALPASPGTFCYACDYQPHPAACDRITLCSRDRACYIGMSRDDTTMLYHYVTGCALRETKCRALEQFPDNPYCSSCCEGDLCNDHCHRNLTTDRMCLDRNPFCPLLKDKCRSVTEVRAACPDTCSLCQDNISTFTIKAESMTSTENNHNMTTSQLTTFTTTPSTYAVPTAKSNTSVPATNNTWTTKHATTIPATQARNSSTTEDDCSDAYNTNCSAYDLFDICKRTSIYFQWAMSHCRFTCGFCHQDACDDTISNCSEYDSHSDLCTNHSYANFVFLRCRRYCHKC